MEEQIYIIIRDREREKEREIDTQIMILLKPSLLDMYLKSNTMSIFSCICTHNVGKKCIFNMSNIPLLFIFNNL